MPAGRTCARCGATLSPDVRWCLACYEPVREYTRRARLHVGDFSGPPIHDRPSSRWAASPTTFGPVGRLVVTGLLLSFGVGNLLVLGATPFGLWFLLGFVTFASFVLRSTWRPVPLEQTGARPDRWLARHTPRSAAPVPRWAWLALTPLPLIGAVLVWQGLDDVQRFFVAAGVIAFAIGCLLGRANEL